MNIPFRTIKNILKSKPLGCDPVYEKEEKSLLWGKKCIRLSDEEINLRLHPDIVPDSVQESTIMDIIDSLPPSNKIDTSRDIVIYNGVSDIVTKNADSALMSLSNVSESINRVRDIIEYDKSLALSEIPEENVPIHELFDKFHPEYFNSESDKPNYADKLVKTELVYLNDGLYVKQPTASGGGGSDFLVVLIPILTIPLGGGGGCILL